MRLLIASLALLASVTASSASTSNFSLYPGFLDRDALIEMTTDKGLIVEIVLRCSRKSDGSVKAGIMTFSKVERLYCSSKNRCFRAPERAFDDTCA